MENGARPLVVAGFARGAGPWVVEHLLRGTAWSRVEALDGEPASAGALAVAHGGGGQGAAAPDASDVPALPDLPALAVLAVPSDEVAGYAARLAGVLPPGSGVVVVTAGSMASLAAVTAVEPSWQVCGLHMLFDIYRTGPQGQTCYVVERTNPLGQWVAALVERAGGVVKSGPAAVHDETMALVQALPHRMLTAFVDEVLRSDVHLEDELWAARTPLFEALLSLGVGVLDTRRENSLAAAQELPTTPAVRAGYDAALARFDAAADAHATATHLGVVRDALTGAAYDSLRRVGANAVAAVQAKRAELALHRRTGALIGLRTVTDAGSLRVGRVVGIEPNTVTLEELLVGPPGRAALLDGPGVRNARRLGVAGRAHRTTFALGHVTLLEPTALQAELDAWLGIIHRDVRLLVPESVSGLGVLAAVAQLPQVRDAAHVDDVVRVGQRSVVLRIGIRADRDLEATVESVRAYVAGVYRWPAGVALAHEAAGDAATGPTDAPAQARVHFLGPRGSFSEVAAGSVEQLVAARPRALVAEPSFDAVLAGVAAGGLGVLPVSSSASGLVWRAVEALLAAPPAADGGPTAGGMIDVAVRFDAYGRPGTFLEDLRGAVVLSHPQAIAQCGAFIRRWGLRPVPVSSTARGLEILADPGLAVVDGLADVPGVAGVLDGEPAVALGVQDRGANLGLVTLEREVDDLPGSITRFLVVGPAGTFGAAPGGARPTLRSVWVGSGLRAGALAATGTEARFDELLSDGEGRFLLVTSGPGPGGLAGTGPAPGGEPFAERARLLGEIPWSPRTPVVRPG